MSDPSHILYEEYSFLPSNRRLRVAYARLNWLCYVNLWCISRINNSELRVQIGLSALENRNDSLF